MNPPQYDPGSHEIQILTGTDARNYLSHERQLPCKSLPQQTLLGDHERLKFHNRRGIPTGSVHPRFRDAFSEIPDRISGTIHTPFAKKGVLSDETY